MEYVGEEEGFTLVELLVVVLIIGLLATIAIPVFNGQRAKAKNAAAQAAVREALGVARVFYAEKDTYAGFCGNASVAACSSPKEEETTFSAVEPGDALSPGASADPRSIWVGNGVDGTDPTGDTVVLCAASRGDTVYCIKDDRGRTTYGRGGGSVSSVGNDGASYAGSWSGGGSTASTDRSIDFASRPSDLESGPGVSVSGGSIRATGNNDWWWLTDSFVEGDSEFDADLIFPSGSNSRDIANFAFYGVTSSGTRGNPGSSSNSLMFRLQSDASDGGFFKVTGGSHSSIAQTRGGSTGGPTVPAVARDVTYHLNIKIVGDVVTAKVTRPDNGTTFTTVTLDLSSSNYLDSTHPKKGYVGEKQDGAGSSEGHRWDNIKITGGL